jgi:HD-GYP domain-containing protein (c-di-GMP phosphodiesterase class II)
MGIEIIKDVFSDSRQTKSEKQIIPLRRKLSVIIASFAALIVIVLGVLQDRLLSKMLTDDHKLHRRLIEEAALDAVRYYDNLNVMILKAKESRIKSVLDKVVSDYKSNSSIESLKLSSYIDNATEDLYLIDNRNRILNSTDPSEKGLDFSKFPDFSRQLDGIRKNGVLFIDGISIPVKNKSLKLFAYLPTPDKKYIVEYGLNISDASRDLDIPDLETLINDIKKIHNNVESLSIVRADGSSFFSNAADAKLRQKSNYMALLTEAVRTGKTQSFDEITTSGSRSVIYIPFYMKSGQSEFGKTSAIELILNDGGLAENLYDNFKITLTVTVIFILVSILISYQLARYVSSPVEKLNLAMKDVGEGHFNKVKLTNSNDEFFMLNLQFNAMVTSIKTLIDENDSKKTEIENMYKELQSNYVATVEALANSIEAKDMYTKGHCERVTSYCIDIGLAMGISEKEMQSLKFAALLHDIGKIGVSGKLLNKEDSLTGDEQKAICRHPDIGCAILEGVDFLGESRKIIMQHHERPDGSGYPLGLKGEEILLSAKILAVADAFDAMTSQRPYRKTALCIEDAVLELNKYAGTSFDASVVTAAVPIFKTKLK